MMWHAGVIAHVRYGHEAEYTPESGNRCVNGRLNAVPGVLELDKVVQAIFDFGHLVQADAHCIGDDGGPDYPSICDGFLTVHRLGLDKVDG